jgi:cytochrome c oxidase subunit 1
MFRTASSTQRCEIQSCSNTYSGFIPPAVYIMILPAMASSASWWRPSHKRVYGYRSHAGQSRSHFGSGLGHHMFVSGQSVYAGLIFILEAMLPRSLRRQGLQLDFATLYKGSNSHRTDALRPASSADRWADRLFVAAWASTSRVYDTYFVIAPLTLWWAAIWVTSVACYW